MTQVYFAKQNLFFVVRAPGEHTSKGIAEKRPSPKFQPFAWYRVTANVAGLESDAIHHAHVNAIGDGMGPLDGTPGIMLRLAEFSFLRRMPSDRRRIKKNTALPVTP